MGGQLGQKCLRRLLGGGNKGKKRLRNTVIVGGREDKKQDNFRGDWVLKTVSYGEVTMPGGLMKVVEC